jgi:Arc/MetJ-type ribon-helix-helix transcriptional regulator
MWDTFGGIIKESDAAMPKSITTHLPDHLARFAEAEVAAGRFASVENVIADFARRDRPFRADVSAQIGVT